MKRKSTMRTLATIEVISPLRSPLRDFKKIRKNAITEDNVEEVAFLPPIVLIKILCIFPEEIISEVSKKSVSLHTTVRLPLALILLSGGILNAYIAMFYKCGGEVLSGEI